MPLPLLPLPIGPAAPQVSLHLFAEVAQAGAEDVRKAIVSGELEKRLFPNGAEPDAVAFIDAARLVGIGALQAALIKVLYDKGRGSLVTRGLASEVLCNLSGTKQVVEAFKQFGVTAATTALLVCRIRLPEAPGDADADGFAQRLSDAVPGTPCAVATLDELCERHAPLVDEKHATSWYKITAAELAAGDDGGKATASERRGHLERCVCTRIACRDVGK